MYFFALSKGLLRRCKKVPKKIIRRGGPPAGQADAHEQSGPLSPKGGT